MFVDVFNPTILSAITGLQSEMGPKFFNTFSFYFALGLTISIFFYTFPNPKRTRTLIIIVFIGVSSVILYLFLGFTTDSSLANLTVPLVILTLFSIGIRVIRNYLRILKIRTLMRSSSHTILYFGLDLILLGTL